MSIKFIRLMSDLHTEFKPFHLPRLDTDNETILILAGDIGVGGSAVEFIRTIHEEFPHIIYVLGNHEYYKHDINHVKGVIEYQLDMLDIQNVVVVDQPEVVQLDGIRFVCGTLWTDMNNNNVLTHNTVENALYDFKLIRNGDKIFTTEDAYQRFQETVKNFSDWIDETTIVVTHHMPSELCVADEFKDKHHMNGGFRSNLHELILTNKPKFWFHGHGHNSVHTSIGDTKIIANPRGYPRTALTMENPDFNPELVIEL